jgi:serine/threonine protein kinase/Tol biopolymer transport system component
MEGWPTIRTEPQSDAFITKLHEGSDSDYIGIPQDIILTTVAMASDRWRQIEELYQSVLKLGAAERSALLAGADPDLRREVEALLAEQADSTVTQVAVGFQLGTYRIEAPIGEGGMGVVYRALDTKLNRPVAVKFLSNELADAAARRRFQREAQLASALNHPHILTVYDAGEFEGRQYLVTEFVDGGTLKTWAKQEPRTWRQIVELLTGVADGLTAAHQAGILHRDIKPDNILVAKNGYAKLADFGLAKLDEGAQGEATRTVTEGRTRVGMLLGTIAYMSPEQASGKPLDARSDIFSFGIVLYEILASKRPFTGASDLELLKTIIHGSPEPLGGEVPLALRNVVEKALEKDAADRYQTMREVVVDLRRSLRPGKEEPESAPQPQRKRSWLPWAMAAVITVAAATGTLAWLIRPAPLAPTSQFTVEPPPDTRFRNPFAATAISPDGRFLVYDAAAGSATPTLWLRPVDSVAARSLPGTEGANLPFWSPDNKSIAFFAGGKLKRVNIVGGVPLVLCDAPTAGSGAVGGAWSRDGVILFGAPDGLRRVAASGGVPMLLTKADAAGGERGHGYPQFLPDGKRFLYFVQSGNSNTQGIYAGSLNRPQDRVQILRTSAKALYAPPVAGHPGYLLWLREGTLLAQRFDAGNLRPEGDPAPLAEDIALNDNRAAFWTSDAGLLVYRTGGDTRKAKLVWIGRDGKRLGDAGPEDGYDSLRLSPNGKRVALGRRDPAGKPDTWLLEFGRGVFTRFTFDPKRDVDPVWSPDGRQIAFSSNRSGVYQLYRKDSAGAGQEEQLTNGPNDKTPSDWSRDGRYLLYEESGPKTGDDIMTLPLEGERKPMVVLQTPFNEEVGVFSPDGKWIAYQSDESGPEEVYVRAFSAAAAAAGGKWQVSNQGGTRPRWRSDGKELFYLFQSVRMMAAGIRMTATSVEIDTPRELFPISVPPRFSPYDVTLDGQRFLVEELSATPLRGEAPLTVVTNWQAGLK